jgi:Fe-S-cluster-containing dehydrogenase component
MIHLDYLDVGATAASSPTVCMHCEDPIAPCAEVCPADAILVTADGVVQEAAKERCIGCANCVHACPFGVPKLDVEEKLQYKCNLCYDRTSVGLAPMCASVCPTGSIFYGTLEELLAQRPGAAATDIVVFGSRRSARVATVTPRDFGRRCPRGWHEPTTVGTERPPVQAMLDRIREDAPVTRRDYLRILVAISGGCWPDRGGGTRPLRAP